MIAIGLTGDVGAGKSTLCSVWREMGAFVVDTDSVARDMWFIPSVQKKVKKRWGEAFFDAEKKEVFKQIADKIFTDKQEYEFMCRLLYPSVIKEIKRHMKIAEKKYNLFVAEVPMLFESECANLFDITVYAAATLKKRTERNRTRNLDRAELKRRGAMFLPRKERIAKADFVLRNSGTEEEWCNKAEKFAKKILKKQKDIEISVEVK